MRYLKRRYITQRELPDKAIDIMDQAGSKVKIRKIQRPDSAKEIEHALEDLAVQESELHMAGGSIDLIQDKQIYLLEEYDRILSKWADKHKKKRILVQPKDIHEVVSSRTGIPVSELSKTEAKRVLNLKPNLKKKIIGQNHAVEEICNSIFRSKSGFKDQNKPVGSFLLLGPTGTGKTYTAKVISESMFGGADRIIQLDMSEYSEKISSSRLVGAAPGYVGYEEGGMLTEKIRKNPYSVVLFDEIEKAHPDVMNMLLQVLEEGFLTDSLGRKVSFSNSIIILTGNVGSELIEKTSMGFGVKSQPEGVSKKDLKKELKGTFKPEFLNRLSDIILFNHFDENSMKKIVRLEIEKISNKLQDKNISLSATPSFIKTIADKAKEEKSGARPVHRLLQKHVENKLSELLLSGSLKPEGSISFGARLGKINYKIKEG